MVDACTRFQAFRRGITPAMWPGVITTRLFSFTLAYDNFALTAMILSNDNQTIAPKIASFLGMTQIKGNVMFAVVSILSATAPLFILIMFFQRQIVSGLTAGAVKYLCSRTKRIQITNFQAEKALVRAYHDALTRVSADTVADILAARRHPHWL